MRTKSWIQVFTTGGKYELVGTRKSNSFLSSFMSHVSFLATEHHPLGVFHLSLTWVFTSYSVLKAMRKWKWFTTFRKRQLGFGESRSQLIWKLETLSSDKFPPNVDWWGSFDTYFTGIYRSATPKLASPSAAVKSTQVTVRFSDDGLSMVCPAFCKDKNNCIWHMKTNAWL